MKQNHFFSGGFPILVRLVIAILFFFNFASCNNKHESTRLKPHASNADDVYCTYKIDSIINKKKDLFALKKGDGKCIYCLRAHNCGLIKPG
jgi:hypothetical protein